MGLDINGVYFLLHARKRGLQLGDVLTIGRMDLNVYHARMCQVLTKAGLPTDLFAPTVTHTGFAEPAFQALGARSVQSVDASGYEGASVVHDMNKPVSAELKQRFDLIYDGGTLEHVFNFPVALQNCMEMLREGGRFIMHTPVNNWLGHGFYQFSPELFYSTLCEENGFEVERMIIHMVGPYNRWYEVANPRVVRSRVELISFFPMQIIVQARRKKIVLIFEKTPQQSDYVVRWDGGKSKGKSVVSGSFTNSSMTKMLPGLARVGHVLKTGWNFWHTNSLANRKIFQPTKKSPFD